jgi:molybdate transport system substrate-binding protein
LSRPGGIPLLLLVATACGRGDATPPRPLSVAAASSLRELLEATAPVFEAEHPGVRVSFAFEASSTLARQIDAGGAFDAFLSADAETLDRLGEWMEASTRAPFLANRLALVHREDLPSPPSSPRDLRSLAGPLALAGRAVPAGKYARAFLEKQGLLGELEAKIVDAANVRAALALVESGAADAAFVYRTDAQVARRAKLAWVASREEDPGVLYLAAAAKGAPPSAAAYVRWLRESAFQAEAERRGFLRVGP